MVYKGYVNVSQLCLAGGKKLKFYLRYKNSLSFMVALIEAEIDYPSGLRIRTPDNHSTFSDAKELGLKSGLLIEVKDAIGGSGEVYAHPEVTLDIATWVSPKLRVWCNRTILLVLRGDFVAITEDAKLAEKQLKHYWQVDQEEMKQTRKDFNRVAFDQLTRNGMSRDDANHEIAVITNMLYQHLFGKSASVLKSERLTAGENSLRKCFTRFEINLITKHEEIAAIICSRKNKHPRLAMKSAFDVYEQGYGQRINEEFGFYN